MTAPAPEVVLDRGSVRAVDRAAIEEYGIPGIVLMENASRGLAREALDMLGGGAGAEPAPRVAIVCGSGNNGGDGYALARHLSNAGVEPILASLGEPRAGTDAAINFEICRRMGIPLAPAGELGDLGDAALVVDAIFGTGLDRAVSGLAAAVIERINAAGPPVLAVDVPSGLDCDTGEPLGATVRATRTVTFVALKPGLLRPAAAAWAGRVVVADIGAPRELLGRFGSPGPHLLDSGVGRTDKPLE